MFGELQRCAAVADGEVGAGERSVRAGLEFGFELAVRHLVDEVERAGPELNIGGFGGVDDRGKEDCSAKCY